MNEGLSLFNSHIGNADKKAKKAFIERFNQEIWDEELQPLIEKGAMSIILENKPNKYTLWYVNAVTAFVNLKESKKIMN